MISPINSRRGLMTLTIVLALVLISMPSGSAEANTAGLDFAHRPSVAAEKIKPFRRQPSPEALKWANQQLGKMSLDEKIGQLISVGVNATFLNQDSDAFKALRHQVVDNHVGGIILFRGPR